MALVYPGSRWWRFDFHVHTPASNKDYKNPDVTPDEWLKACMAAKIDAVVVTDHNSGDWLAPLKASYAGLSAEDPKPEWFLPVTIFPGVEITVSTGVSRVHLLAVFDPDNADEKTITAVLGQCGITNGHGDPDRSTTTSFEETVEIIKRENGIPIPAHIDGRQGLLENVTTSCQELERSLKALPAAEFCDLSAFDEAAPELRKLVNALAKVGGSDAHAPEEKRSRGNSKAAGTKFAPLTQVVYSLL